MQTAIANEQTTGTTKMNCHASAAIAIDASMKATISVSDISTNL
jgi:hypothetical protein